MSARIQTQKRFIKRMARDWITQSSFYKIFSPIYGGMGSILMFHDVAPKESSAGSRRLLANQGLEVTPQYLEAIIKYLIQKDYAFVSMDEVYSRLKSPQKQKKRFVCFTFDDGYLNNYTLAYPIFKKYNIPLTIYVAADMISDKSGLWWLDLETLLLQNEAIHFDYEGHTYAFQTESIEQKEGAFLALRNTILTMNQLKVDDFLTALFTAYPIDLSANQAKMMSWEQIRELSQDPLVTIGAHTMSHASLKNLPDAASVRQEMLGSKSIIEAQIGKPVEHFAYPYGDTSCAGKREFGIAEAVGFKTAVMAVSGNVFPAHKNYLYSLPRIYVSGEREKLNLFELALSGTAGALANRFRRAYLSA